MATQDRGEPSRGASGDASAAPARAHPSDRAFRRSLLAVLLAALVGLLIMAAIAAWLMVKAQDFNRWVEHTYLVESHIARLQAQVERAETARRGFLLVPTEGFRSGYEAARSAVPRELDDIGRLTADNPQQQLRVKELSALTEARARRVVEMMAFASKGDLDAAVESFRRDRDQPILGRIRQVSQEMTSEEQHLLKAREAHELDATRALFAVVLVGGVLLLLLTFLAVTLMRRYARDLEVAQGALRRLNEALEARVAERTAELRRANEEIQRFAYIVSHDLRSPLVNVMGFTSELELGLETVSRYLSGLEVTQSADAEALQAAKPHARPPPAVLEALRADMPEAIGFIRSSSQKMDRLINAILKLSREGRRTLTTEDLDMNSLIGDLLDGVRHRLIETGAEAAIEGELPPLSADRLAVEQIFGNLVDNAVKYLDPRRTGSIHVRGRATGGKLIYEVADNGRGIDAKDHERIFELFRRSGAQDQPGEGIGLAHVRALVYRLGGRIELRSELGRGSTFIVSFPTVPATA